MPPTEEHTLRNECKGNFNRHDTEIRDLTKQPDGAIPCMQKKIGKIASEKVSFKVLLPIIALLVTVIIGSYGYSNSGQKEHRELVTKEEMRELKQDVEKKIDEVKEEIKEVETELKQEMQEVKKEILDAIRDTR